MQKSDSLIHTKLCLPSTRPSLVPRQRLQEQIEKGLRGALTLITAPAGFGKTTLVVSCVANRGTPVAWLSLDKNDNQARRFLRYLVAALREADYTIGSEAAQMLAASQQVSGETILTSLINDLDIAHKEIILVLDDYQFINNQAVHEEVAFLLEHCPHTFHLVITTRSDPPLPLSRSRARSQMVEIRAADLRFTKPEATQFLNDVMGLRLDAGLVEMLEERTEGWIVGLQMAALSLHGRRDPEDFIQAFGASHRLVIDYLMDEVLNRQSPDILEFLLHTSILTRFCQDACDYLLDQPKANPILLESIERMNLFLIPLDDERCWYRYHHLFADLLRNRLHHTIESAAIQKLYCRASQWYEEQRLLPEAIEQALAAPDLQYAGDLLERKILPFFYQSEIAQVNQWLELLPKTLILQRPLLCAVYAASISMLPPYPPRAVSIAQDCMQAAEDALPNLPRDQNLARAFIFKMRSYWARWCDESPEVVFQLIAKAQSAIPADPSISSDLNWLYIRSALQTNLAMTYWAAGDVQAAKQAFEESRKISIACNDLLNASQSINHLIKIHLLHGELEKAATLCRESLNFFDEHQDYLGHRVPLSGEIGIRLAEILIEQNELTEAEQLVKENLELAKWTMGKDILLRGNLALARLAAIQGNTEAAFEYLRTAEKFSDGGAGLPQAQRASLWIALSGEFPEYLDLARRWRNEHTLVEFGQTSPQTEWAISLVLAHIILLLPNPPKSISTKRKLPTPKLAELQEWVNRQVRAMQTRGWVQWEIPLLLCKCHVYLVMGNTLGAEAMLQQVLELAASDRYVRVFLDEGQPMQMLLAQWLAHASAGPLRDYATHLHSQFDAKSHTIMAVHEKVTASGLVEPLSQRELEILHLIALGRTNREIASQLIVAPGTVKAHTASIYRKLDVANRTEAVARARQLDILP